MTKRSDVLWLVIKDMTDREEKGFKTYNKTMDRDDLSELEWLNHAYEEALDLSLYLKKIILSKKHGS